MLYDAFSRDRRSRPSRRAPQGLPGSPGVLRTAVGRRLSRLGLAPAGRRAAAPRPPSAASKRRRRWG